MVPFVFKSQKGRNPAIDRGCEITNAFYPRLAGLYPDLEEGWHYWIFGTYLNLIYIAYAYFVSGYFIANVISLQWMDVELIGTTFCFGSYTYTYFFTTLNFHAKRAKIDKLMEIVGNELFVYQRPPTEEEEKVKEAEILIVQHFGRYAYYIPCFIAAIQLSLVPAIHCYKGELNSITNETAPINKYVPLQVWSPVDPETRTSFLIIMACHMLPGFVEYCILHGTCVFFTGVIGVLVSNVKILHLSIKDIKARALYRFKLQDGVEELNEKLEDNPLYQECLTECLKENIIHHIQIIKFYNLFQDIIAYPIFYIVTGAAVTISTPPYTLLKLAEMGDSEKLFNNGIVMAGHTFLSVYILWRYCKFGQNFVAENSTIIDSFYESPWFEANDKYKRLLLIALSNSQKPMEMKAAVVGVSFSAATFLDVIKTSYSLLNFLIQVR